MRRSWAADRKRITYRRVRRWVPPDFGGILTFGFCPHYNRSDPVTEVDLRVHQAIGAGDLIHPCDGANPSVEGVEDV
jgi:hypothetical protein